MPARAGAQCGGAVRGEGRGAQRRLELQPAGLRATRIGQRVALSAGDVAAANSLIPGVTPPAPPPAPPTPTIPVPYPGRFLKYPPITSGPDVATWQAKMVERGFTLDVDGKYGPKSRAAAIEFQKQQGLTAAGIVGPLTWAATFATS